MSIETMRVESIVLNGHKIGAVESATPLITDGQSALDLLMNANYQTGGYRIAVQKAAFEEAFFDLRTGLLGEALQKFSNYNTKLAIYGDFSGYTSKALRDFIRESNRGSEIFFVATKEEALERLSR